MKMKTIEKILSIFFDVNTTSNSHSNPPKGLLSYKPSNNNSSKYDFNGFRDGNNNNNNNNNNNILYGESLDLQEQKSYVQSLHHITRLFSTNHL